MSEFFADVGVRQRTCRNPIFWGRSIAAMNVAFLNFRKVIILKVILSAFSTRQPERVLARYVHLLAAVAIQIGTFNFFMNLWP
jgi:hypothetical protein